MRTVTVHDEMSLYEEQWKPIAGHEGLYEVSNMGRVRSLTRRVNSKGGSSRREQGQILKPHPSTGYVYVALSVDGLRRNWSVHRLVATAFLENPENKPQVNHIHQPKTNNAVTNLEWATRAEDDAHTIANGLQARGSAISQAKLTEAQVVEIRKLYAQGKIFQRNIATMFGVNQVTVSSIVHGKWWKHVPIAATKKPVQSVRPVERKAA